MSKEVLEERLNESAEESDNGEIEDSVLKEMFNFYIEAFFGDSRTYRYLHKRKEKRAIKKKEKEKKRKSEAIENNKIGNDLKISGDINGAIKLYKKASKLDPSNTEISKNLETSLKEKESLIQAIKAYQEASKLDPKNKEFTDKLKRALHEKKSLNEVVEEHSKELAVEQNKIGNDLRKKENLESAISAYNKARFYDSSNIEIRNNLIDTIKLLADKYVKIGDSLKVSGDLEGVITAYGEAINLEPKNIEFHEKRLNTLVENKDLKGAINQCRKIIKINPSDAVNYFNLGNLLKADGNNRKIIKINPSDAEVYLNLENLLKANGNTVSALINYKRASKIDPSYKAEYFNNLGEFFGGIGFWKSAIRNHRKAIELKPDNTNFQRDLKETIRRYAENCYKKGKALEKKGRLYGAVRKYKKALKLDPKNTTYKRDIEENIRESLQSLNSQDKIIIMIYNTVYAFLIKR